MVHRTTRQPSLRPACPSSRIPAKPKWYDSNQTTMAWGEREDIGWAKRLDVAAELSSEVELLFAKQAEEAAELSSEVKLLFVKQGEEDWEGRAGAALGSAIGPMSRKFSPCSMNQPFDRTVKKMDTWCIVGLILKTMLFLQPQEQSDKRRSQCDSRARERSIKNDISCVTIIKFKWESINGTLLCAS
eukprot:scaffold12191_cov86-Skeletonema_marinoi.AAC.1